MDDELSQLEAELKRLRPVAPARDLFARIEREMTEAAMAPTQSRRWWLWAAALPAAAAIAVMLALNARREHAAPASESREVATQAQPAFKPVAAENVLYAASDDGLVTLDDGTAARREVLRYVDTITWRNPRTNASVRMTVPREEVRVVPVIFQ